MPPRKIYLFKAPPESDSNSGGDEVVSKRGHHHRKRSRSTSKKEESSTGGTGTLLGSPGEDVSKVEVVVDKQQQHQVQGELPGAGSEEPQPQQQEELPGPSKGSPKQQEERPGPSKEPEQQEELPGTSAGSPQKEVELSGPSAGSPQQELAGPSVEPLQQQLQQLNLGAGISSADEEDASTSSTSNKEEDRFITHLRSMGFDAELIPVLAFQYTNMNLLWSHLKEPHRHSGIIFSSPRCVKSVAEAVKQCDTAKDDGTGGGLWESSLRDSWACKPVYCVGPATVTDAERLFGVKKLEKLMTGLEAHAESLATKIIEEYYRDKPASSLKLLYPCGTQRRDVLMTMLKQVPINCAEIIVYATVMEPSLPGRLKPVAEVMRTGEYSTVLCFFSPSGVRYVFQALEDPRVMIHEDIKFVALGPTTKSCLLNYMATSAMRKPIITLDEPTPASLVDYLLTNFV